MKKEFFEKLPDGKITGFCESVEGDLENSVVIVIPRNCGTNCLVAECHMFKAVYGKDGKIIGRLFKTHPPEY